MKFRKSANEKNLTEKQKRQLQILKRYFPEYKYSDWVLWIIPELYNYFHVYKIAGMITVKKENEEPVCFPYCVNTPYNNEEIHQLSYGKNLVEQVPCYGIPLIFHTFEELSSIKYIEIRWEVLYSAYPVDHPLFKLQVDVINTSYQVSFHKNQTETDAHFFTLENYVKNRTATLQDCNGNKYSNFVIQSYYDKFDKVMHSKGFFDLHKWFFKPRPSSYTISECYDYKKNTNVPRELAYKTSMFVKLLPTVTDLYDYLYDEYVQGYLFHNIDHVYWDAYLQERNVELCAENIADFSTAGIYNISFQDDFSLEEHGANKKKHIFSFFNKKSTS